MTGAEALRFLQRLRPTQLQLVELQGLVAKLGAPRFVVREMAERQLIEFGQAARAAVGAGLQSELLEVQLRARRILDSLDSSAHVRALQAALLALARQPVAGCLDQLLEAMPFCLDASLREPLAEALAANVTADDANTVAQAIADGDDEVLRRALVRAATLRAEECYLEIVRRALQDRSTSVRILAVRELADRGERIVLESLVDLMEDEVGTGAKETSKDRELNIKYVVHRLQR